MSEAARRMTYFDIFEILIGKSGEPDYKKKPVIIQGMTGSYGSTHTRLMKSYGTNVASRSNSWQRRPVF